jgi:hypothetical protein
MAHLLFKLLMKWYTSRQELIMVTRAVKPRSRVFLPSLRNFFPGFEDLTVTVSVIMDRVLRAA